MFMQGEFRIKEWEPTQERLIVDAKKKLLEFESAHSSDMDLVRVSSDDLFSDGTQAK